MKKLSETYIDLMSSKELVVIDDNFDKPLIRGTLFGYKAFGENKKITASYPIWEAQGKKVIFVLCYSSTTGKPILDQTLLTGGDVYINKEPIVVSLDETIQPTFFQTELSKFFPDTPSKN